MYVCIYVLSKKRINSINFWDRANFCTLMYDYLKFTKITKTRFVKIGLFKSVHLAFCASLCVFEKISFLSYV